MDHLHRLGCNIPDALLDAPDGVYEDTEAFLSWLEGATALQEIKDWEHRRHLTLAAALRLPPP